MGCSGEVLMGARSIKQVRSTALNFLLLQKMAIQQKMSLVRQVLKLGVEGAAKTRNFRAG
jgi:hypothetical protein